MPEGNMPKNKKEIPHSAKYTAATWRWADLPYADVLEPPGSQGLFKVVNAYMFLYRLVNPQMYSLKNMLVQRHKVINALLQRSGCQQFIEYASGFSPRGSYVSEQNAQCNYYEFDLPEVVSLKRELFMNAPAGRKVLKRENYQLKAGNIQQEPFLGTFPAKSSFVITEGLMMYFSRTEQKDIWCRIARFLSEVGGAYVFDYIPLIDEPPRSVIGQKLHQVKQSISKGEDKLGFSYDQRTRDDVKQDLMDSGFGNVTIWDRNNMPESCGKMPNRHTTPVLVFHCTL